MRRLVLTVLLALLPIAVATTDAPVIEPVGGTTTTEDDSTFTIPNTFTPPPDDDGGSVGSGPDGHVDFSSPVYGVPFAVVFIMFFLLVWAGPIGQQNKRGP